LPFARIHLELQNADEPEQLIIQALLGADDVPIAAYPYVGWRGIPNPTEWCWPLIFKPDGQVDYGGDAYEDRKDRLGTMNIYQRPFSVGEEYIMEHYDDTEPLVFKVINIKTVCE
jgi:hypothetical protein